MRPDLQELFLDILNSICKFPHLNGFVLKNGYQGQLLPTCLYLLILMVNSQI